MYIFQSFRCFNPNRQKSSYGVAAASSTAITLVILIVTLPALAYLLVQNRKLKRQIKDQKRQRPQSEELSFRDYSEAVD